MKSLIDRPETAMYPVHGLCSGEALISIQVSEKFASSLRPRKKLYLSYFQKFNIKYELGVRRDDLGDAFFSIT